MYNKNKQDFTHLHVHTQYSLLDGAIKLDDIVTKAKEFNMSSVAITDHGTMFGALDFYNTLTAAGIKPVIGCEFYITQGKLTEKKVEEKNLNHLVLLARNNEGYENLCKLASIASLKGFYYKPRIDKEVLVQFSKGIICLSACLKGEIPSLILEGKIKEAKEAAYFYQETFGEDNFFLEIQDNGIKEQDIVNEHLIRMSREDSFALVATNDCHYLEKEHSYAHELLLCIQTNKKITDQNRFKFNTTSLYFKSPKEMFESFAQYPDSLSNTIDISKRCNVEFVFNKLHFPHFEKKDNKDEVELFKEAVIEGFEKKFAKVKKKNKAVDRKIYQARLDYEMGQIIKLDFAAYFLIVVDFIRYARANNIPVGPGRGSVAGSLVAYSLDITQLDPIEHGLIFERFLNPGRINMPDIDVDFDAKGREKVLEYVKNQYDSDDSEENPLKRKISQVITFGTLKTKAVIKDIGRALGFSFEEVNKLTKIIPDNLNIQSALKESEDLNKAINKKKEFIELFDLAKILENLPRHSSTHAAGLIISDVPLVNHMPIYKVKDRIVTQYDMKCAEKLGFIKFDFLGLKTLTVIDSCLDFIRQSSKKCPDIQDLNFKDKKTLKMLCNAKTVGVFQVESLGMRNLLFKMQPEGFEDISAIVALFRPGPLSENIHIHYVERKHGREEISYLTPEIEPILKETYGLIIYQEQVMQIAVNLAKYSMSEADDLRKAMGKKDKEKMAESMESFAKRVKEHSNLKKDELISKLTESIKKFSGYAFNKSHSVVYAYICFQTAFLKANFPVEFMAALLSSEIRKPDKMVRYINETRAMKINIVKPDINISPKMFKVEGNKILFGLVAIKNAGEAAIDIIIESREKHGKFASFFDFCKRMLHYKVNKRTIEYLIQAGAFDSIHKNRKQLSDIVDEAIRYAQLLKREEETQDSNIFALDTEGLEIPEPVMQANYEDWEESVMLKKEKDSLGFYFSGHPLNMYYDILEPFNFMDSEEVVELQKSAYIKFAGVVFSIKEQDSRQNSGKKQSNKKIANIQLGDLKGFIRSAIYDNYSEYKDALQEDSIVIADGFYRVRDENDRMFIIKKVYSIDETLAKIRKIVISIDTTKTNTREIEKLHSFIRNNQGDCKIYIDFLMKDTGTKKTLELHENVQISNVFIKQLKKAINYEKVTFLFE